MTGIKNSPGHFCLSNTVHSIGQNAFHITFGDSILPRMSRDFAISMAKHLAGILPVNSTCLFNYADFYVKFQIMSTVLLFSVSAVICCLCSFAVVFGCVIFLVICRCCIFFCFWCTCIHYNNCCCISICIKSNFDGITNFDV